MCIYKYLLPNCLRALIFLTYSLQLYIELLTSCRVKTLAELSIRQLLSDTSFCETSAVMASRRSVYPDLPGDQQSSTPPDGKHLIPDNTASTLTLTPEPKIKAESLSPIKPKHNHSVSPSSNLAFVDAASKVERSSGSPRNTGRSTSTVVGNLVPGSITKSSPSSFPASSAVSLQRPTETGSVYPSQSQRPRSTIGTAQEPFRTRHDAPTAPEIDLDPFTLMSAFPQSGLPMLDSIQRPPRRGGQNSSHVPVDHGDREDADSVDASQQGQSLQPQPNIAARRRSGMRLETVESFAGYPPWNSTPPALLSCYEVCQRYPASLCYNNLEPFIQRRFSAEEIFACFPDDVQQIIRSRGVGQVTMYLYKRLEKKQKKLRQAADGTHDYADLLALMNGDRLREDGRPAHVRKHQSNQPPNALWRRRSGLGVDPDTGLYVELPDQSEVSTDRMYALLTADPRDMPTQQLPTQSLPTPFATGLPTFQPNLQHGHTGPHRRQIHTQAPAGTGPRERRSVRSTGTQTAPLVLADLFPTGTVGMRGAYEHTIGPDGNHQWQGIPSAEFVDSFVSHGRARYWLDLDLPQDEAIEPTQSDGDSAEIVQSRDSLALVVAAAIEESYDEDSEDRPDVFVRLGI